MRECGEGKRSVLQKLYYVATMFLLGILLLVSALPLRGEAAPVSENQVHRAASTWLGLSDTHLEEALGENIQSITRYDDDQGAPLYYIVYLNPRGFLVVAGDDLVEPIIAFVPEGTEYVPSQENPLGTLVTNDLSGRIDAVRNQEQASEELASIVEKNTQKWNALLREEKQAGEYALPGISEVRVAPLLQSTWSQSTVNGQNCYNYYTPNNYVCGCVATAMAQLMRHHQKPTVGIGVQTFTVEVDGVNQSANTRGGNGSGGAYVWSSMVLQPNSSITEMQRQAIGALTYDAGVSVEMSYTSSSSGANTLDAATAFTSTFGYGNAIKGYNGGSNLLENSRNTMILPNLDAGYPVLFGITGAGGHAIVGDGYGYDSGTLYHHLNMGWSGTDNAWYNLPDVSTTYYNFTSVYKAVYNVFPEGVGEILSGRVVNSEGLPLEGVTVTASGGGNNLQTVTNAKGIYAFAKIPSGNTYTVSVSKNGINFDIATKDVVVSTSQNYGDVGNVWGVDFLGSPVPQGSWVIGTNGNTYRYEDGSWTWTPAKADYVAAVDEDTCWISQTGSNTLYKYDNGTWTWTPAKSKWISAYGADTLWLVQATTGTLYRYESGSWIWTPAKAKNISAPSSDVLWLIQQSSENLYRYTISTNTWEWTSGKAQSISAASENIVWLVGLNGYLYKYDHSTEDWTWHNVQAQAVSAISETEVLFVNPSGKLCRFEDGVVSVIGGSCKDLSAYPIPASSESAHSSGSGTSSSKGEAAYPEGGCSLGETVSFMGLLLLLVPLGLLKRKAKP